MTRAPAPPLGLVLVVVVLGAVAAAGRKVEARGWCCGRGRSSSSDFVAARRMASAAVFDMRWCFLSAVGGTASPAASRSFGCGGGSDCVLLRRLRCFVLFAGSPCIFVFVWGPVCKGQSLLIFVSDPSSKKRGYCWGNSPIYVWACYWTTTITALPEHLFWVIVPSSLSFPPLHPFHLSRFYPWFLVEGPDAPSPFSSLSFPQKKTFSCPSYM